MIVQAAAGDTWGIPGPTFLLVFVGTALAILVGALVQRRRLFAGPRDVRPTDLSAQQAAYLNGGERLAVYTSLGGLRTGGTVSLGTDKALTQSGAMAAGATPLDQAIYNAAGQRTRPKALTRHEWVRGALAQLRADLERAGLALPPQARWRARFGPLLLLGLVLVGWLRAQAGAQNDKPIGLLFLTMLAVGVVAVVMFVRVPRRTTAANTAVRSLRERHMYLSPAQSPAYATYGAGGAAMGIALFGAGSLYAIDPAIAAGAQVSRHSTDTASSGTSTGCGGGGSCGGGGGCGGCGG